MDVEQLRALAFASIPLASRNSHRWVRNGSNKNQDKEEGELSSSDDEVIELELQSECKKPAFGSRINNDSNIVNAANGFRGTAIPQQPLNSADRVLLPETQTLAAQNHMILPQTVETRENPFLIKFSEDDSDSEGDQAPRILSPPSDRIIVSSVPKLNVEINRMKKQIAAMEKMKLKSSPAQMKSGKTVPLGNGRVPAANSTDPNLLEHLRKQIASKESELQQKRQRMTTLTKSNVTEASPVKNPASGMGKDLVVVEQRQGGAKHAREEVHVEANKKAKTNLPVHVEAPTTPSTQELTTANLAAVPTTSADVVTRTSPLNASMPSVKDPLVELKELEMEEDTLDKELELAQQLRHTCEIRERLARRSYRDAQEALRRANMDCERLHQKREMLSFKVKAAEFRHYSGKAFSDEQLTLLMEPFVSRGLVPSPGPVITSAIITPERPGFVEATAPEPMGKASEDGGVTPHENDNQSRSGDLKETVQDALNQVVVEDTRNQEKILSLSASGGDVQVVQEEGAMEVDATVVAAAEAPTGFLNGPIISKPEGALAEQVMGNVTCAAESLDKGDKVHSPVDEDDGLQGSSSSSDHIPISSEKLLSSDPVSNENGTLKQRSSSSVDEERAEYHTDSSKSSSTWRGRVSGGLLVVFRQFTFRQAEVVRDDKLVAEERSCQVPEKYESPLMNFRSFKSSPYFNSAFGFKQESSTWNHALDPFKPICTYELRGKCNDEFCPMQHEYQYKPESTKDDLWLHEDSQTSEATRTTTSYSNWTATTAQVPVYRIGRHLMGGTRSTSANDLNVSAFRQRTCVRDMPCLLDNGNENSKNCEPQDVSLPSTPEEPSRGFPGVPRDFVDVDLCLDFALNILQYEVNMKRSSCLKNALCVLSRSLEVNRQSVTLWVVYLTLFYKNGSYKQHDMFLDAVQCNKSSYVLWCMLLDSRSNLKVQLDSYEQAISALCETNDEHRGNSACILDLVLRMLYCMEVSETIELINSWTDDLLAAITSSQGDNSPKTSAAAVVRNLQASDACVLGVSCAYFWAYGSLPRDVVSRLGCRQEPSVSLEWEVLAYANEDARSRIMKLLKSGWIGSSISASQVLTLNYIKYIVATEGLEQAAAEGQQLMQKYPCCVEMVVLFANIEKQRGDSKAALAVFESAILNWPSDKPGVQVMWNQYAGHALEWVGEAIAVSLLERCASAARELCHLPNGSMFGQDWVRHSLSYLSSTKRNAGNAHSARDATFSLLNLALYEALLGNMREAQGALEKALASDEDVNHCWQEYAAFWISGSVGTSHQSFSSLQGPLTSFLDKYSSHSQLLPKLCPLGRGFLKEVKRHRNRCFIDNLLGATPPDHGLMNSLLRALFGSSLLPSQDIDLKSLQQFAGGLLEIYPGNTEVALALCRIIKNSSEVSRRPGYIATSTWAASHLINSLEASFPVASESHWLEARQIVEQLGLSDAFCGFYCQAEAAYPFSAKLWRCRLEQCKQRGGEEESRVLAAAKERGLSLL